MRAPAAIWIGRLLSGLVVAFLLAASVAPKLVRAPAATEMLRAPDPPAPDPDARSHDR